MAKEPAKMRIIGIDPGYAITGYGIVDKTGSKFEVVDYGAIETKAGVDFPLRLLASSISLTTCPLKSFSWGITTRR